MTNKKSTRRREFLVALAVSVAVPSAVRMEGAARRSVPAGQLTIADAIEKIISRVPTERLSETVDTVKAGDPSQPLKGIATTFLPSCEVIEKTAELGSNLLITHEPTFYNHPDETGWLERDPVYLHKRELLEEAGIVVWRFHDYHHRLQPDPVVQALISDAGWQELSRTDAPAIVTIPQTSLRQMARDLKERLNASHLRFVGDPAMPCRKIAVLPGSYGGRMQINILRNNPVDALVVGEIDEWETNIYVADTLCTDQKKGLVILGHADSEEPAMKHLVGWLKGLFPGIPVHHVPLPDPFHYV